MFTAFINNNEKVIQDKISKKIYRSLDENNNNEVLDMHFFLFQKIGIAYRDKENPLYLINLINACNESIEFSDKAAKAFKAEYKSSLPSHTGFKRLAIIFEKEKRYKEAIKISKKALFKEWSGDNWEKRISRCQKKIEKA
jgi:hypothetical protein